MKQKREKKQRISLTFLVSGIILSVLVITSLIVGLFILLFIDKRVFLWNDTIPDAGAIFRCLVIFSVIIGAILAFFASHAQLKPINKILNAMNKLADGDYSVRLAFKGPLSKYPIIKEFTDSFNKMAAELSHTEVLHSDFVNNFSHEFKTPIVSIAGFAKLLKRGNLNEKQRMEYLETIEEESLRLSEMATNVMNLTRIENKSILTDVKQYNLTEQIRNSILVLEGKWDKKNLDFSLPMEEYHICGSQELLAQVWINLLDNAIKFSSDYSLIEVNIKQETKLTQVTISNSGVPIPEESLKKIFNKFYQADESHAAEGNGIGLAIVKKIVDLHKGSVNVTCKNGKTNFEVTLPDME